MSAEFEEPPLGFSASFLRKFQSRVNEKMSTQHVAEKVVMREARPQQCAYIDVYRGERDETGTLYVDKATVYVCHAWADNFANCTLDVVLQYAKAEPKPYFYLDLFSTNLFQRHEREDYDHFLEEGLPQAMDDIGTILVVFSSWTGPSVFKRMWCLYEMYSAAESDIAFHAGIPSSELQALTTGQFEMFAHAMAIITQMKPEAIENANCFDDEDADLLLTIMSGNMGLEESAELISTKMRIALVTAVLTHIQSMEHMHTDKRFGDFIFRAGTISLESGELQRAIEYYNKSLKIYTACQGAFSDEAATVYNMIAEAHKRGGQYGLAVEQLQLSVGAAVHTHGEDSAEAAKAYNLIGQMETLNNDVDNAIKHLKRGIEIALKVLPAESVVTGKLYENIGTAYTKKGKLDTAIKCLQKSLHILSANNPCASSLSALCTLIADANLLKRDYNHAMAFYQKSLLHAGTHFGARAPELGALLEKIATCCVNRGCPQESIEYYNRCLRIYVDSYGEDSCLVARIYHMMGRSFLAMREPVQALENLSRGLMIARMSLPEDNDLIVVIKQDIDAATLNS